jgi:signal transduction histidine kinase/ActR/RegA family two-component response regulator
MTTEMLTRLRNRCGQWLEWIVPDQDPLGSVGWWRGRMLGAMLLAYALFGTLLVVPMIRLALSTGALMVVAFDLAMYGLLLGVAMARRAPRAARAWFVVLSSWAVGVFFSWGWGGNAAGPLWLITAPVLAGVLLGIRAAAITLGVVSVTTVAIGVFAAFGMLPWAAAPEAAMPLPPAGAVWLIIGANLLFLAIVVSMGTAILAWGLAVQGDARRRAEDELLLMGRALEHSDDVVLLVDHEGHVAHRNRREAGGLAATLGDGSLDALGFTLFGAAPAPMPWRDAFAGTSWIGRCVRDSGDEQQHFVVSVTPVRDATGAVSRVLVVLRDVTREHALEERLRVSAKLEAVGTMVSGIAHDFNNLLQPIIANVEELRHQLPADHPGAARVADIEASASRGRGLVRRILTYTRGIEVPRVPTSLAEVCDEAVRLTEVLRASTITLEMALAPDGWVLADPAELHHALVNLISNACDAMPDGGRLRLTTYRDGAMAVMTVEDTGHGMDDATRSRVFMPFFSTKAAGRGSGLGLSTVHGTITALGGTIDVSSVPGRGTSFIIRLPAIEAPTSAPDVPTAPTESAATKTRTVLVVDDDDAVRRSIVRLLRHLGYDVFDTGDPREAVSRLAEHQDSVDLLLTDLSMPGMTGIALATRAHALAPRVPIILMTGLVDTAQADAARAEGVTAVVQKPFTQQELRDALERAFSAPRESAAPLAT